MPTLRWTFFALTLGSAHLSAQATPPWKEGDPPPMLVGLHLGDSREKLDSVLGKAESVQDLGQGAFAFGFQGGHLVVSWTRLDGVAVIDLKSRDAGALGGFRVGDSIDSLVAQWGPPPRGEGPVGLWVFGPWAVVVRSNDVGKQIVILSLGRVF